jgi:lysozyme
MLKVHEGLRLKAYEDSTGNLTIGFGHNLENGISKTVAEFILSEDIAAADAALRARFPWTDDLDEVRRAVLVDQVFNMGIGGLATFKATLDLIHTGDYEGAAKRMLKSLWARQVGPRAIRLSEMMRSGEWPPA